MGTVQVVLGAQLRRAADRAARRSRRNRSALIREALIEYLRKIEIRDLEARDRRGFKTAPQLRDEFSGWEKEAAWPAE